MSSIPAIKHTSRRDFLKLAGLYTLGFTGLRSLAAAPLDSPPTAGFGPLIDDPAGLIRLPRGFRYTRFSATGDRMDDGLLVPGKHDGMATFPGPEGRTLLVRNHELESTWTEFSPYGSGHTLLEKIPSSKIYDGGKGIAPNLGGTTTLVFDTRTQRLEKHFLSLAGTVRNCAGGPTPWGTWISCEEVNDEAEPHAERLHGYNFEVQPTNTPHLSDPIPLTAMGRFRHEAIAVHPKSGVVYQTEDIGDGLLYRFVPNVPGKLQRGGKLQALVFCDAPYMDTRNWKESSLPIGKTFPVRWMDLEEIENPKGDLRYRGAAAGAALFARGEGAWWNGDCAYFAMTNGGEKLLGQVFRYIPSPDEGRETPHSQPASLELFIEPNDSKLVSNCDNLTIAPNKDLILCEDTNTACRVIGVTPQGNFYVIAEQMQPERELAGACFSPDGSTLFLNVQTPGYTLAITGPWKSRRV